VILAGADVARVEDQGDIPRGVPLPAWPDLSSISLSLVAGALAVAAIVLVQGVGVAESAPNEDGSRSDANGDFIAQGVGNITSGFFQGQPVGGSVGQTALNRTAGARTRWAAIFSGLWMLLILVLFSGVVGAVVMPTLAALLIYAAAGSFRFGQIATIWRTGPTSQIAISATFVATLLLPVALAVGLGVVLSLLLQLNQAALDLKVVELVPGEGGQLEERAARRRAASHAVILLDVYGTLHYAGARTLQHRLPDPTGTEVPAIVLRMRGRSTLGATFFAVLTDYARQLDAVGGRLYVSGLDPALVAQAKRTREHRRRRAGAVVRSQPPHRRLQPPGVRRRAGLDRGTRRRRARLVRAIERPRPGSRPDRFRPPRVLPEPCRSVSNGFEGGHHGRPCRRGSGQRSRDPYGSTPPALVPLTRQLWVGPGDDRRHLCDGGLAVGTVGATILVFLQIGTVRLALHASRARRGLLLVANVLFVVATAAAVLNLVTAHDSDLRSFVFIAASLLYVVAPVSIIRNIVYRPRVDQETMLGALAAYLLIGMAFAFACRFIGAVDTAPFFGSAGEGTLSQALFFSVVTLTTTGYGNLVPSGSPG
jgi:hypothetical protein